MPKYWVKNYFAHGRFSEVGKKQKTEESAVIFIGANLTATRSLITSVPEIPRPHLAAPEGVELVGLLDYPCGGLGRNRRRP